MMRLLDLYPATWRARYEREFEALLAARPPSVHDRIDIARGALDAHLHPQHDAPRRVRDRRWVFPAAGFVSLWLAVWIAANGAIHHDAYGEYRDGAAALPVLFLATVLLSIGLAQIVQRLPADADWSRLVGWTAVASGPAWSLMPWVLVIGLVFIATAFALALASWRYGVWPGWAVVALGISLLAPAGLFAASLFLPWYALRVSGVDMTVVILPLSLAWLLTAAVLLRGFPERVPG